MGKDLSKERAFYLYMVTCRSTGKRYIGITSKKVSTRWRNHVSAALAGSQVYFHKAIRKYGSRDFVIETLARASSWGELCALERSAIEEHGTLKPRGYNLTLGGEGTCGLKYTPRRREKLLLTWQDPEFRRKVSLAHKERMADPELRSQLALATKKALGTEKEKARRSAASKTMWSDASRRARHSQRMKELWSDPSYRDRIRQKQLARFSESDVKRRRSEALRKRWADPEYKARRSAKARESMLNVWKARRELEAGAWS